MESKPIFRIYPSENLHPDGRCTAGCHCGVRAGAQPPLTLVTALDAARVCAVRTVLAGWLERATVQNKIRLLTIVCLLGCVPLRVGGCQRTVLWSGFLFPP